MRRAPPPRRSGPADEPLDPTTKKGLIAAGIMVVIGAVVFIVVSNKKAEERRIEQEHTAMVQGFLDEIKKTDTANMDACDAAIKRIDAEQVKWLDQPTEADIRAWRSKLTGAIDSLKAKKEFLDALKAAEDALQNVNSASSDELVKIRQKLGDIEGSAEQYDPALPGKIRDMKVRIDHILVGKMRDEALKYAADPGTTARQGLAKYAAAEDYVRRAVEDAQKAKKTDDEKEYTEIYKKLLDESDAYTAKVLTPEFIDSILWKDLLSGEMAQRWSKTTNVPGFSCRVENGTLSISPPDKGVGQRGVASILDQPNDNLRHFVLDMEFSMEGLATMFFHVNPPPNPPDNRQAETFDLEAKEGGLRPNAKYNLVCSYFGSQIRIEFHDSDDGIAPWQPNPSWVKRRRGGIAFVIPEGTRLRITRMRIKELR